MSALAMEKSLPSVNEIGNDGGTNARAILQRFIYLLKTYFGTSPAAVMGQLHTYSYSSLPHPASNSKELRRISTSEIPKEPRLQDFELDRFGPGRHELELVVAVERAELTPNACRHRQSGSNDYGMLL